MKITEMVTLLRAGYSKAEIDELRREEGLSGETSMETTEGTNIEASEETSEETPVEPESNDPISNPLQQTVEELTETIKELQKMNLANARQPDIPMKSPLENASDILFKSITS